VRSDRGSQYCSKDYQSLIRQHKLLCSMSAKRNCYDNAVAESFFHTLKVEAIHGERFPTRALMRQTVFESSKWTTIEPADTLPAATSARWRLRLNRSLSRVSVVGGQDQDASIKGIP
jgi:transposase InsO family protein